MPAIVVPLPQVANADFFARLIFRAAPEACKRANFVLQYPSQSDLGRSTVRFATWKLKTRKFRRHPEARLWRGTRKAWPRLFYV
jgi:hypothetical protein